MSKQQLWKIYKILYRPLVLRYQTATIAELLNAVSVRTTISPAQLQAVVLRPRPPPTVPRIVENGMTPELNKPRNDVELRPRLNEILANPENLVLWQPVNRRVLSPRVDTFRNVILPYIDARADAYNGGIPRFHRVLIRDGIARPQVSRLTVSRRPKESTKTWFRRLWWMLYESTKNYNDQTYYAYIEFTPRPALPPLEEIKTSENLNCVVQAVIDELNLKPNDRNKSKIAKLTKLSESMQSGAGMEEFRKISKIARLNIIALDILKNTWHEFFTDPKQKNLILTIHNNHAYKHEWQPPKIAQQEIVWDFCDTAQILSFPSAKLLISGDKPTAIITDTKIYKEAFPGCKEYPGCFSEAGIGKLKIIAQNKCFKNYRSEIGLFDSIPKNLYIRNAPSKKTNKKHDMNQAYRNHECNLYYRGIPDSLTVYTYESYIPNPCHAGLVFITGINQSAGHIHFSEGINKWYPLEFIDWVKDCGCCSFTASHVAIGFAVKPDYSKFTKNEFRKMVGRCASQESIEVWATTDENEFKRALFTLGDRIVKTDSEHHRHHEDSRWGEHDKILYFVYYRADRTPWNLPVIPMFVKSHHNLRVYSILNKLADKGIKPIAVNVDGIEVEPKHEKELLIAIADTVGGFKRETPRDSIADITTEEETDIHDTLEPEPAITPPNINRVYTEITRIATLTHIAGEAGNAKTQWIADNIKSGNLTHTLFCASTGKAARNLKLRANVEVKTVHKLFGIGCRHTLPHHSEFDRVVIEEISMVGETTMNHVNETLQHHCHNTLPFGGKDIVIVGDFGQLQAVKETAFNYSELYKSFTVVELTVNYRQNQDPNLYKLCKALRTEMTVDRANEIIALLNCLVVKKPPSNLTLDDVYIAGTNRQVDEYNLDYPLIPGNKAMLRKKHGGYCNGDEGIITKIRENNGKSYITLKFRDGRELEILNDGKNITRSQAQTVHLCQGETKTGNVIIDPSAFFTPNHLYVALTRATTSKKIRFTRPITLGILMRTCNVIVPDAYEDDYLNYEY